MSQNKAKTNVPEVAPADGLQKSGSLSVASLVHSPEFQPAHLSKAGLTPQLPSTAISVKGLQACLDENVSGVSKTRDQLLALASPIDAVIDRMSEHDVVMKSACLNFDLRGTVRQLRRMLKYYYSHQRISHYHLMLSSNERMQVDFLVVIDFEATCAQYNDDFVQEIIEFPAVLVDVRYQVVRSYYRSFCKPKLNPILTDFCTSLTGITQAQVDKAKSFKEVLENFEEWLNVQHLGTAYKFAVVTDGPWDMAKFLRCQLELSDLNLPLWATQWINIRKVFRAFYDAGYVNLQQMVNQSGLQFLGRPHCGLDDAMNIAAVALKLLNDGCIFTHNEYFRSQRS